MNTPIYFISDIHLKLSLDKDEVERRNKLYRLFDKILDTGGTCFFVGDLFDFYFEYPDVIPNSYFDFFDKHNKSDKSNYGEIRDNLIFTLYTHPLCQSVDKVITPYHFVIKLRNLHCIKTGFSVFCIIKIHIKNIRPRRIFCGPGLKPT